jgi:2-alkyl-3-oxoalkanoate reductase
MIKDESVKCVLVTGANGFIGTSLINCLCKIPNLIIKAMILKGTPTEEIEKIQTIYNPEFEKTHSLQKLEIVFADMMKKESMLPIMEGVDIIVHLAGLVTDWAPKDKFFALIVDATKNILDVASTCKVKRFIYMSSLTVSDLNGHHFDDESVARDMKFFQYGVAKRLTEDVVTEWAMKEEGRDYALMRPGFIIYGPNDKNSFIRALDSMLKGVFGFVNGGKALISYVYVENLAHGISLLVNSSQKISGPYIILDGNMGWKEFVKTWTEPKGLPMPKLNVPYGLVFPFIWLLEKIYRLFRTRKPPILTIYSLRIPAKDLAFSGAKMEKELGYKPIIPFPESIQRTLAYYDQNFKTNKS